MRFFTSQHKNLFVVLALVFMAVPVFAQDPPPDPKAKSAPATEQAAAAESGDALRKAAQNPVASLISVPIQENWNFGIGPADRTQNILHIQPVIPLSVGKNWNLIT